MTTQQRIVGMLRACEANPEHKERAARLLATFSADMLRITRTHVPGAATCRAHRERRELLLGELAELLQPLNLDRPENAG